MSQRPVHHRPASTNRPLYLHRSGGGASSGSGSSSTATFHSFAALLAKTATLRSATLHNSRSGGVEDVVPSACSSSSSSSYPSTHATTTTAAATDVVVPSRPSTVPVPAIESRTSSSSTGSGTTMTTGGLSGSRSGGGFPRWPPFHPSPSCLATDGAPLVSSSAAPTLRFAFPSSPSGELRALPQDPSMPNESAGGARFTMIHDAQPNAPAVIMADPPIQSVQMQNFSANQNITSSRPLSSRADMESQLERDRHRRALDDIWRQLQTTRRQLQDATQIHLTALQHQAQRYEILAKQTASYHQLDCEEREERFRIVAAFFRSKPTETVPRVVSDPPRSVRDSDLLRTLRAKDRVVDYLLEELTQRGWTAPSLRASSYARGEEEGMDLKERLMRYCSTPMDALAQKVAVVPSLEPAATWVYLSLPKPPQAPPLPDAGTTVDQEQERFSGVTGPAAAAGADAMLGARTWSGGDSGKRRPATQPGGRRKRLMMSQ